MKENNANRISSKSNSDVSIIIADGEEKKINTPPVTKTVTRGNNGTETKDGPTPEDEAKTFTLHFNKREQDSTKPYANAKHSMIWNFFWFVIFSAFLGILVFLLFPKASLDNNDGYGLEDLSTGNNTLSAGLWWRPKTKPSKLNKYKKVKKTKKRAGSGSGAKESGGGNIGVGSWFATNAPPTTNGKSWCGYRYNDNTKGFAVSLKTLSNGEMSVYGSKNWKKYGTKWCGLEAIVTNPANGKSLTLYIADAFDPKWVKGHNAIDIVKNSWSVLAGYSTNDHNKVISNVQWRLTGKRSRKYCFGCAGN